MKLMKWCCEFKSTTQVINLYVISVISCFFLILLFTMRNNELRKWELLLN